LLSPTLTPSPSPLALSLPDSFFLRRAHHFHQPADGAAAASDAMRLVSCLRAFHTWTMLHACLRHSPSVLFLLLSALSSVDQPAVVALARVEGAEQVATFAAALLPSQRTLAWRCLTVLAHVAHSADMRSLPLPTVLSGLVGALTGTSRTSWALQSAAAA